MSITVPLILIPDVLFPGMPMPLHIHAEQELVVLRDSLEQDTAFGVVRLLETNLAESENQPYDVGTLARIRGIKQMEDDSLKIMVIGEERFKTQRYIYDPDTCLFAKIDLLHDSSLREDIYKEAKEKTVDLFNKYFHILMAIAGMDIPEYELPDDPEEFSFIIASALQLGSAQKQKLLEMTDTVDRLRFEIDRFEKDLARLQTYNKGARPVGDPITAEEALRYLSRN
jgi:Lon protease-like protein